MRIKNSLCRMAWFLMAFCSSIAFFNSQAQAQSAAVIFEPSFVANATADDYIEFVENGGDLFAIGPDKRTALHYAVRYGSASLVDYLVRVGIDVNKPNVYLNTPLHWAVSGFDDGAPLTTLPEKVQILLAAGAEVNALAVDGETPLMFARTIEIAQILLDNGADITIQVDPPGMMRVDAVGYHNRNGNRELGDFLLEYYYANRN